MNTEKMIEEKIMDSINNGDRDMISLLWALTGIVNINESFGNMPAIEDMIKDMQSTHTKYPQKAKRCMQVYIESMEIIVEKWKAKHEIS